MQRVGDFWVPDIDMRWFARWGKIRRKTIRRYKYEGGGDFSALRSALSMVPNGRVAIDGGANVGAASRILANHFERVLSFEPAEDTFAALSQNIIDWELAGRVTARACALSDESAKVGMGSRRGQRSVSRRVTGSGTIDAITLDALELDDVDFIKLDVEGHELSALKGASATLIRCRPAVLFEDKPDKLRGQGDAQDPHSFLRSLGAEQVACLGPKQFDYLYRFPNRE